MVKTPHTYWGIPRSVWQPLDIQRVLLGRPAPRGVFVCLSVSVVLAGRGQGGGRKKKFVLEKESGKAAAVIRKTIKTSWLHVELGYRSKDRACPELAQLAMSCKSTKKENRRRQQG